MLDLTVAQGASVFAASLPIGIVGLISAIIFREEPQQQALCSVGKETEANCKRYAVSLPW